MHLPPFTPAAPLLSLSASALVLGSAYTLRPRPSDPVSDKIEEIVQCHNHHSLLPISSQFLSPALSPVVHS